MPRRYSDSDPEDGELDDASEEEPALYCICRKPDTNRFMIGCDECEEWFHGDCVNITAQFAKKIQNYYCPPCKEKNPKLDIVFKEGAKPQTEVKKRPSEPFADVNDRENKRSKRDDDEGSDFEEEARRAGRFVESDDDDEDYRGRKKKTTKKPIPKPSPVKTSKSQASKSRSQAKQARESKRNAISGGRRSKRNRDSQEDWKEGPKQCYGPGCIEAARKGSKYCSDACGLRLSTNRIYEILPNRVHQWNRVPTIAEENDLKTLTKIRSEQEMAKKRLTVLHEQMRELDVLIERAKQTIPFTEEENEEYEEQLESEADLATYCVTCGHEISNKMIVRHMERCFAKYEAQFSAGSIFKTKIDNLFCDVFNPQQKTYCKRLRVLCPEHTKEGKIGEDEVCGFPLVANVFKETGTFCKFNKKKCARHHGWERVRRALIDMERVQQWLKIDELFEKEQRVMWSMSQRGGVIGLMLHQTLPAEDMSDHPTTSPPRSQDSRHTESSSSSSDEEEPIKEEEESRGDS